MSNNPNQTTTWLFCLQQVFDLILLCPVQSLVSTRTPTKRERGSASHHFKPRAALGPGLDTAKLLRVLSPPQSAAVVTGPAKAADLLSENLCPAALLLCGGDCHLPLLTSNGTLL